MPAVMLEYYTGIALHVLCHLFVHRVNKFALVLESPFVEVGSEFVLVLEWQWILAFALPQLPFVESLVDVVQQIRGYKGAYRADLQQS